MPKQEVYTFADILNWDEEEQMELIDGELFMMAPPSSSHQFIVAEMLRQFGNYLEGKKCRIAAAPFGVRLFEKAGDNPENVDTMVEPDLIVMCDTTKIDSQGYKGAPDLIVEVLSPSTMRHDRLVKFNLYQKAGVKEYWIVDPKNKSVQVFLRDGKYLRLDEDYSEKDIAKVNVLENCMIDLKKVFAAADESQYNS